MNFAGIEGGRFWGFDGKAVRPLNVDLGRIPACGRACGRKGRHMKNNIFPEGLTFCLPALYHVRFRAFLKAGAENFPNRVH